MQRSNFRVFAAALATLLLAACGNESQPESAAPLAEVKMPPADLVLRGGTVATADPAMGSAEAIAVTGYQVTAVGSNDDMSAYIGPETEVVELNGLFVMPGFIEGHGHYLGLGRSKQILDLQDVKNWGEVVTMVSIAVDKARPGEWIFGRGWHQDKWDSVPGDAVDGVPRNDTLNEVSPDHPVILGHASGHAAFWNDAAMEKAGVGDDTSDPAGGTIVRTPEGKATGLMRETAQRLINAAMDEYNGRLTPEQTEQLNRERVQLAADEALSHGVTSFHDAGSSFETIDFFKKLEEEGNLDVRLYVMVRREDNELMAEALVVDRHRPLVQAVGMGVVGRIEGHQEFAVRVAVIVAMPCQRQQRNFRRQSAAALIVRPLAERQALKAPGATHLGARTQPHAPTGLVLCIGEHRDHAHATRDARLAHPL